MHTLPHIFLVLIMLSLYEYKIAANAIDTTKSVSLTHSVMTGLDLPKTNFLATEDKRRCMAAKNRGSLISSQSHTNEKENVSPNNAANLLSRTKINLKDPAAENAKASDKKKTDQQSRTIPNSDENDLMMEHQMEDILYLGRILPEDETPLNNGFESENEACNLHMPVPPSPLFDPGGSPKAVRKVPPTVSSVCRKLLEHNDAAHTDEVNDSLDNQKTAKQVPLLFGRLDDAGIKNLYQKLGLGEQNHNVSPIKNIKPTQEKIPCQTKLPRNVKSNEIPEHSISAHASDTSEEVMSTELNNANAKMSKKIIGSNSASSPHADELSSCNEITELKTIIEPLTIFKRQAPSAFIDTKDFTNNKSKYYFGTTREKLKRGDGTDAFKVSDHNDDLEENKKSLKTSSTMNQYKINKNRLNNLEIQKKKRNTRERKSISGTTNILQQNAEDENVIKRNEANTILDEVFQLQNFIESHFRTVDKNPTFSKQSSSSDCSHPSRINSIQINVELPSNDGVNVTNEDENDNGEKCEDCEKVDDGEKCNDVEKVDDGEKCNDVEKVDDGEKCNDVEKVDDGEKCNDVEKVDDGEKCNDVEKDDDVTEEKKPSLSHLAIGERAVQQTVQSFENNLNSQNLKKEKKVDLKNNVNKIFKESDFDDEKPFGTKLLPKRHTGKRTFRRSIHPSHIFSNRKIIKKLLNSGDYVKDLEDVNTNLNVNVGSKKPISANHVTRRYAFQARQLTKQWPLQSWSTVDGLGGDDQGKSPVSKFSKRNSRFQSRFNRDLQSEVGVEPRPSETHLTGRDSKYLTRNEHLQRDANSEFAPVGGAKADIARHRRQLGRGENVEASPVDITSQNIERPKQELQLHRRQLKTDNAFYQSRVEPENTQPISDRHRRQYNEDFRRIKHVEGLAKLHRWLRQVPSQAPPPPSASILITVLTPPSAPAVAKAQYPPSKPPHNSGGVESQVPKSIPRVPVPVAAKPNQVAVTVITPVSVAQPQSQQHAMPPQSQQTKSLPKPGVISPAIQHEKPRMDGEYTSYEDERDNDDYWEGDEGSDYALDKYTDKRKREKPQHRKVAFRRISQDNGFGDIEDSQDSLNDPDAMAIDQGGSPNNAGGTNGNNPSTANVSNPLHTNNGGPNPTNGSHQYQIHTVDKLDNTLTKGNDSVDDEVFTTAPKVNQTAVLSNILENLKAIKQENPVQAKKTDGMFCPVVGTWLAEIAGVKMVIREKERVGLVVEVQNRSPPTKDAMLSSSWTFTIRRPFTSGGPFVMLAIDKRSKTLTRFIGQCRICHGRDMVTGIWSFIHPAKDCRELDLSMSQLSRRDVFRREKQRSSTSVTPGDATTQNSQSSSGPTTTEASNHKGKRECLWDDDYN